MARGARGRFRLCGPSRSSSCARRARCSNLRGPRFRARAAARAAPTNRVGRQYGARAPRRERQRRTMNEGRKWLLTAALPQGLSGGSKVSTDLISAAGPVVIIAGGSGAFQLDFTALVPAGGLGSDFE